MKSFSNFIAMNLEKNIDTNGLKDLREALIAITKRREREKQVEEQKEKDLLPKVKTLKESLANLTIEHLQPVFKMAGEEIVVAYNDPKIKGDDFIELLFYPKGFSKEIRGVNTAALRFVFNPKEGRIRVLQRNSLFPLPLKESESISIDENSELTLSNKAIEFAKQVAEIQ